jgi:hypothetical protein
MHDQMGLGWFWLMMEDRGSPPIPRCESIAGV